jgi:phosphonate transport system substrate-binding protein
MGERYQHRPIYFSDVVVRHERSYTSFEELAGCCWAYNETASHSGYNLVYADLLRRGVSLPYFGKTIRSGSHLDSLRMVLDGKADATAIDSHVLDVVLRRDERLAAQIRVVAMLGPSAIPPVVVARRLDPMLKRRIKQELLSMHRDAVVSQALSVGGIERFVSIEDELYNDIRAMYVRVQSANVVV